MRQQTVIEVMDTSQVGEARRVAAGVAKAAHLDVTAAGKVAIIVTELATNLVRYGGGGRMLVTGQREGSGAGRAEIVALDAGPGMDTARCIADGYSTGGTPGNGLGAVQRLAADFDIYSAETGTAVMAIVGKAAARGAGKARWGAICLPAPGEDLCGDNCGYGQRGGKVTAMIADGLGHGPDAAIASSGARRVYDRGDFADSAEFIQKTHDEMAGTRGAAVAAASIDGATGKLDYTGVGNIAGALWANDARRGLPSANGIVGLGSPRVKAYEYAVTASGMLIMHSDGLQGRWLLENYPGLAKRHPLLIASVLYRDFYRGRDDVTVLVGAWEGGLS